MAYQTKYPNLYKMGIQMDLDVLGGQIKQKQTELKTLDAEAEDTPDSVKEYAARLADEIAQLKLDYKQRELDLKKASE